MTTLLLLCCLHALPDDKAVTDCHARAALALATAQRSEQGAQSRRSYDEARRMAAASHRPLVVWIGGDFCPD